MAKKGDEFLGDRRKALEEEFFRKENERLRQRLHEQMETEEHRAAISRASGISDPAVLDRLVALGLDGETVTALSLVPLIDVAWADGRMEDAERTAVLSAARAQGVDDASPAGLLLESWLSTPPPPRLREAWTDYVGALSASLEPEQRASLRDEVVGRARAVAEAAGGFLGLGSKVSGREQEILERLEAAFG
ncbi:MAG: hypothetical protein ABFS46_00275 [Myxococcota bacterium]